MTYQIGKICILSSLACRCAEEAKLQKFLYFGIRSFGYCYGGNIDAIPSDMMSSQCFQGKSFGPCEDSNEEECGGEHAAEYVYELKTATGKGKNLC